MLTVPECLYSVSDLKRHWVKLFHSLCVSDNSPCQSSSGAPEMMSFAREACQVQIISILVFPACWPQCCSSLVPKGIADCKRVRKLCLPNSVYTQCSWSHPPICFEVKSRNKSCCVFFCMNWKDGIHGVL
jgi:hypothetical protein